MNFKLMTTVLLTGLSVQGCSFFEKSDCNNPQVTDAVKRLYASQVNINPLKELGQLTQKLDPNSKQEKSQNSFAGIELSEIKQLDLKKLQVDRINKNSVELAELISDRFEGAQVICEGVIQQDITSNKLAEITQKLSGDDSKLIKNDKLNIPVVYGLYPRDGSEQFDVQYTPKKPLHLMLGMMLQKK